MTHFAFTYEQRTARVARLNAVVAPFVASLFNDAFRNAREHVQASCVIVDERVDTQIDMHMCFAYVTFNRPYQFETARIINDVVHDICVCDETYEHNIDGDYYLTGDGDDTNAVEYHNGMLKIWIRSWGDSQYNYVQDHYE